MKNSSLHCYDKIREDQGGWTIRNKGGPVTQYSSKTYKVHNIITILYKIITQGPLELTFDPGFGGWLASLWRNMVQYKQRADMIDRLKWSGSFF